MNLAHELKKSGYPSKPLMSIASAATLHTLVVDHTQIPAQQYYCHSASVGGAFHENQIGLCMPWQDCLGAETGVDDPMSLSAE